MTSFFFAPESPRLTALIRIALGFVLLCEGLAYWRYAIELYSTAGPAMPIFVRQVADESDGTSHDADHSRSTSPRIESLVPLPIPSPPIAVLAHTALVVSVLSVALGWHTRTSLVSTFLLAAWLWPLDLPVTFGKQSVVALHILLLLAFSRCGAVWSVDYFSDCSRTIRCPLSSAAPRRLMQILVCCVYMGAAITKLKTPAFVNGDLLTFSLLDDHWGSGRLGLWLTTIPHVSLLLNLATLFFELLFPFLVWIPRLRWPLLGLACAFHAALGCLLSIGIFPAIMFTALLSFVEERDLAVFLRPFAIFHHPSSILGLGWPRLLMTPTRSASEGVNSLPRWRFELVWNLSFLTAVDLLSVPRYRHSALYGAVLHLAAAGTLIACGLFVQCQYDWYGVFGRRPLPALREIAADDFAEMLAERLPAYEDYIHRIDVGSRFGGNQIFGASHKFKIGQRAYILAQLIQPHPAIELEGLLIAPDGQEVARFTHRVDPGTGYAINGFELTPELPLGNYRIILQAEGFVVVERQFDLDP